MALRARRIAWFLAEGLSDQLWALRACLTSPFTLFRHSHTKYTHPNTKYTSLNSKHTIPYTKYTHRTCSQMIVCVRRGNKNPESPCPFVPPSKVILGVGSENAQIHSLTTSLICNQRGPEEMQPRKIWNNSNLRNFIETALRMVGVLLDQIKKIVFFFFWNMDLQTAIQWNHLAKKLNIWHFFNASQFNLPRKQQNELRV